MTQREKILAGIVSLLVVCGLGWLVVSRVTAMFDARHQALAALEDEVYKKDRTVAHGEQAAARMARYEKRSLPGDPLLARSLYQGWLLELAENVGRFEGVNVGPLPGREVGDVYYQHAFLISCQGNLAQLTEFLHGFYSVDYLHRVKWLHIKPISKSKTLNLSITVEALSMKSAPAADKLASPASQRLAYGSLENYLKMIGGRNLFAPANNPPRLASMSIQRGNPNRSMSFRMQAVDPDELDQLTFNFDGEAPTGARIDPRSGEVQWTPRDIGEYQLAVRVTDNGLPPMSHTTTVNIDVNDPPAPPPAPPPAGFDAASETVVSGIIDAFGRRQVFLNILTEGRVVKLAEGDEVAVGSVQGKVLRIGQKDVEIETADGKRLVVGLGRKLVAADEAPPLGGL